MNDGSMADKEERLLEVITQYKGDFTQVKTALDLHEDIKVPDDIAVLSVTGT